ncbi:MAG TPA: hypothetical protein PL131_00145 [Methylotenera sp.]|nr:hypothetical protein [Methylotenera sp.]HPH04255.1 hypothetical protein [Methylotenera sp.]HPM99809.1 hypothetical protein [Methylotenera sp.]
MTNKPIQDAHLKKALEHAPDTDVQVRQQVRNTVLDYAKKATQPQNHWLASVKNWLLKDHFANAQWAGLTGLATVILVTVLLLRDHPEETIWTADTPATISENSPASAVVNSQTEGAILHEPPANVSSQVAPASEEVVSANADSLTTSQSAPLSDKNITTIHAEPETKKLERIVSKDAQLKETTASDQVSKADALDLAKSASKPLASATTERKATENDVAKQVAIAETPTAITPATPAAAPIVAEQNLPAAEAADQSASKPISKPKATLRELTDNKAEAGATITQQGSVNAADADFNSPLHAEKRRQKLKGNLEINSDFAEIILLKGGQAMAKSDTEAGNYRLFKVITHSENYAKKEDCIATKTPNEKIDERSGFPIINIDVCTASAQLLKEVEIYNKTMIDWYFQYQTE